MIPTNENPFFKSSKCNGGHCKDELFHTCLIQECTTDFPCSGFKSASDQSKSIQQEEKYPSLFTHEVIDSIDLSLPDDDKNDSNMKMDYDSNLGIIPEECKIHKGNEIMIVNYQFARKEDNQDPKNVKEKTLNISLNESANTKHNRPNKNFKQPDSQSEQKHKKKTENSGKNPFITMNEEPKQDNDTNFHKYFPRHIESSFITKEFKTSFFDDFLDPNSPYFSYPDYETFGCSSDCLGLQMAPNFQVPPEKIVHIPVLSYDDYKPQVCYIEPKYCGISCQGIPYRNQGCGIFQGEPKVNPESIISNCCKCNNLITPEDAGLNEMGCCGRKPIQTDLFEDVASHRRYVECCSCKEPADFQLQNKRSEGKKKKCFTCCQSGKVDQEELSRNTKPTPQKREQDIQYKILEQEDCFTHLAPCSTRKEPNFECCQPQCIPPNIVFIKNPFLEQYTPQTIRNHSKCDRHCPFKVKPEKDNQSRSQPITKSVACGCEDKRAPIGLDDDKIDVGKNITIQIMPCGHSGRVSSEHRNISVAACPKMVEKITYPSHTCCAEKPSGRPNEPVWFQPCMRDMRFPYDQENYQGDNSKEKPFSRWWNCNWRSKKPSMPYQRLPNRVERRDCCTTTGQELEESDYQTVTFTNCQRVLPIKNAYINRDGNLLKSLHRLNRGLLQDLFATPCPSSSSACQNSCSHKIRGAPYPVCATVNPLCMTSKPQTTHQSSQYEPDCNERVRTLESSKDIMFECLKYLKKGVLSETQCDYVEEDCCCCCCCCCQSCNNCCCCHRTPRYCESREIPAPKVEEKKPKSCRCRSVEAKQSLKNCGTIVSNQCFTKVETVCTNTEIRPKTPKPKMKRRCCHRKCCCCCNQNRNCCCCCEPCCYSEPITFHRNVHKYCNEHLIYRCECETNPISSNPNSERENTTQTAKDDASLEERIELLTSRINDKVSKETLLSNTKENANAKFSDFSNTTEKSTSTNSTFKLTPQTKDVMIRSLTLDLCDLGDKEFSKFGLPSRQYPWTNYSFFPDMPHEIYRFIGIDKIDNPLTEKVYDDPTPCLKPQVLHDDNRNEQNAGGDIEKEGEVKKRSLSTICEALFDKKQRRDSARDFSFIRDHFSDLCNNVQLENKDNSQQNKTDEENKYHPINIPEVLNEGIIKSSDDETSITQAETLVDKKDKSNKSISKTSQSISKVSSNISKKSSNISKTSSNISRTSTNICINYTPKPFTTKTGLMSFIPSFRDIRKTSPQIKKNRKKTTPYLKTENNANANILDSQTENQIESKTDENERELDEVLLTLPKPSNPNEKINNEANDEHEKEILTPKDLEISDKGVSEKNQKEENEMSLDLVINEQTIQTTKAFDLKKFNEEMHAFYEKCFKTPNISTAGKMIPFYNARVSDIIKSLESRSSVNFSQKDTLERNESNSSATITDQKYDENITFPSKSNIEFYSDLFQRSYESNNNMKIPEKIMSKADLISLN